MDVKAGTSRGRRNGSLIEDEANLAPIIPLPPDGGWGWVIITVCSLGNLSVDTVTIVFPTIQYNLSKLLNKSLTEVTLIISVHVLICYLLGSFSGVLANRIGFRYTMMLGASLGTLGLATCFFLQSYLVFILCIGVTTGLGSSFVYMVSMAAPGFWFEEKRALAAGISTCASGLAAILVPPVAAFIEKEFNWRYVILIPTGLFGFLVLLSLLIRTAPAIYLEGTKPVKRAKKVQHLLTPSSVINLLGRKDVSERKLSLLRESLFAERAPKESIEIPHVLRPPHGRCKICKKTSGVIERPMYKKDIFFHGNVEDIRGTQAMLPGEYTMSVARMPTVRDVREEIECRCTIPEAIKRGFKTLFDFTVFKNKIFLMVLMSTFFFYNGVYIPFLYLKRVGIEHDVDEMYATYFTPVFGVGLTISRATVGLIMLISKRISAHTVTVCALLLSALISFIICLYFHFIYQIIVNIIFGYCVGLYLPLRSVILADYVGLEKLTSAMGFVFTIQGIASFSGMPIAEILIKRYNDTRLCLYFSAAVFMTSGIFLVPIYCFPLPSSGIKSTLLKPPTGKEPKKPKGQQNV